MSGYSRAAGKVSGLQTRTCRTTGIAAGSDLDQVVFVNDLGSPITVKALKWVPDAAITANATNYFDLKVVNKGTDGSGTTAVSATIGRSWAATNSVAAVSESLTVNTTAANLVVTANQVLTLEKDEAASGLTMPEGYFIIEFIVKEAQ